MTPLDRSEPLLPEEPVTQQIVVRVGPEKDQLYKPRKRD